MNPREFKTLLKHHEVKCTQFRLKLFRIFLENRRALNFHELERSLYPDGDRVTLYRALKVFMKIGFIHRVTDLEGNASYAATLGSAQELLQGEADQHLHFCCIKCRQIFCIINPSMPTVSLPETYTVHSLNMTITGVCKACNDK